VLRQCCVLRVSPSGWLEKSELLIQCARPSCLQTRRFVSTSNKHLTSYGWDEQRNECRSSRKVSTVVFNIKFHDNLFITVTFFFHTHMPRFNHHRSFSFLKVIMKKPHLPLETPLGCLAIGGLPPTKCFSAVRADLCLWHKQACVWRTKYCAACSLLCVWTFPIISFQQFFGQTVIIILVP